MKDFLRAICLLLFLSTLAFGQKKGDIVVATRQTQFKLPVEAQRGERWEILKYDKSKVVLTFGPQDERRAMIAQIGEPVGYELEGKVFVESFVPDTEWPVIRKSKASDLQKRFVDLSLEQCEKLLEGALWVGMARDHAMESVGNRILKSVTSETAERKTETWKVGAFSLRTTVSGGLYRDFEENVRIVLTFKDGVLDEIVRRKS